MSINRVFLLGNLGADPELRYTPSQMPVCSLRIATSEKKKGNDGQWTEITEWHSVVVWGKSGENCAQYLSKGRQVFVEGRLQTRKWQDQEGKDRYRTEIIANTVQFIGGGRSDDQGQSAPRNSAASSSSNESAMMSSQAPVSFDDDDIPF